MKLHYTITNNNASQWLLCFYGYGQQIDVFDTICNEVKNRYNIIRFDLDYTAEEVLTKAELQKDILELLVENNIKQCTLLSFSLGGRFNFCIMELLPQYIIKSIAIAPDGIKVNKWNMFGTKTILGKKLFQFFVFHPSFFQKLIKVSYTIKVFPKTLYTFCKWHMRDLKNRKRVYAIWMQTQDLVANLKVVKKNIDTYGIECIAVFGLHDEIIHNGVVKKFKLFFPDQKIIYLPQNHNLLNIECSKKIAPLI